MGRKIRAGNQQALLHEFAHHLTVIRGGVHYYYHREPFVSCLIEITTFWYGDPEKYNWEEEYFSVMNAAYEILSRKYKEAYAKARA